MITNQPFRQLQPQNLYGTKNFRYMFCSQEVQIHGIDINGVAIGSYARNIVRKYIERDDFLTNKTVFNEALDIAKKLIDACIK